ncbi:MAG: amidohydrolase family protein, partial [Bradyrhizobium sp.]|nr:amidohydrolase family protein [Bradyrhizobium sp.]
LSGLGTFIRRNDPGHVAGIVGETIGLFGAERCLFGSNFPIEKLWTDYRALVAAYEAAIQDLDAHARAQVMGETARRIYRLG